MSPVTKPYTNTKLGKIRTLLKGASESLMTAEKYTQLAEGHLAAAELNIERALVAVRAAKAEHASREAR